MGAVFQIQRALDCTSVGPCCTCGVEVILLAAFERERRKDHSNFYCPNGHPQHFPGKSREEKLAEENAKLDEQLAAERLRREHVEQSAKADADRLCRVIAATRGEVTKMKNRVGNGVCPCCNRTFQNLMRHMSTKHPAFAHEGSATLHQSKDKEPR